MRGRRGVADRRITESYCLIGTRVGKHDAPDSSGLKLRPCGGNASAPAGQRSMPGGEFRGVGDVEFVDLLVDLGGREAG